MRAYLTSFSISRAGAVAAVAHNVRLRRALPTTIRLAMLSGGAVTIGLGAALTLATGLGPGPFDVLVAGISNQSGLSFALSLWVTAGTLAIVSSIMGHRPGPGTLLAPLIIGPVIQFSTVLFRSWLPYAVSSSGLGASGLDAAWPSRPQDAVLAAGLHLLGVVAIGFGAGAMITSGLGAGTGDLVAGATSSKLGRSVPLVRTGLELSWLGIGLTLGGPVGVGTILVALTIGPAVRFGHGRVEAAVTRTLGQPLPDRPTEGPVGRGIGVVRDRVAELVGG